MPEGNPFDPCECERPLVTVDVAIFALQQADLHVLLVRRKRQPYEGLWAIPGGFVGDQAPSGGWRGSRLPPVER